jgi:addiction module RelB/DinJ family antitoxin
MKVQSDVRVTIRVDKDLKERAESLFDRLGMNMSTALNVFLRKAVDEEAIPFTVSSKSAPIGAGYASAEITRAFETAVQSEIEENKRQGFPVARYDMASKQAYLEAPDGTREYINE